MNMVDVRNICDATYVNTSVTLLRVKLNRKMKHI